MKPGKLYLIPNLLGDAQVSKSLPSENLKILGNINYFFVEKVKTARAFLKKCKHPNPIQEIILNEIPKHDPKDDLFTWFKPLFEGTDAGLISEAGLPAIADPGENIIKYAHDMGIQVVPLVGPNSILMALMASGLNGQGFTFHGYLPIDKKERSKKLKTLEILARQYNQTQIFMETPYRNSALFDDIVRTCSPNTTLCLAKNITLHDEYIKTRTVGEWKAQKPNLHKQPCIFLLL